jgi:hypothetical protein
MIYTDVYLFDLATGKIDAGENTIHVADYLVRVCGITREHAARIVSVAFDPSQGAR